MKSRASRVQFLSGTPISYGMDLDKLNKIFELTKEILFMHNDAEVIRQLNDELWRAGYETWITRMNGELCLSVRPRDANS